MAKKYGPNTILMGVIIMLLVFILVKNSPNYVVAQQGDGGATAKHVFGVVGHSNGGRESFYLVDTRNEVIMMYEYNIQGNGLGLITTRSYKYDKLLNQYGRTHFGPEVNEIKKEVQKQRN
ncbi:MAG: hypothetical protein GY941_14695 [Planctomycetes bacterium]|nr:hypothetical protein [Planctomycetota bacterium]